MTPKIPLVFELEFKHGEAGRALSVVKLFTTRTQRRYSRVAEIR